MNREYVAWVSPTLGRRMELLWFGHGGRPMIWFPTSKGRFYQNEDFGLVGAVGDWIDQGRLQICCVDSVDDESFYATDRPPADRIRRHDQYDRYVYSEVVPFVRAKGSTQARIGTLGASFGAYHAVNFGLRHPDICDKVIGFSGKYDIHSFLDGYWDETCYFHCPTAYIPNMNGEFVAKLSRVGWVIATGEYDTLVQQNRDFSNLLWAKGIPNHSEFWGGAFGHDWPWWREHLRRFV